MSTCVANFRRFLRRRKFKMAAMPYFVFSIGSIHSICPWHSHCRMRSSSWWFLLASNQNSGIRVLFSAEFNGIVQIPNFRQAHHYKTTIFGFWAISYKYILLLAFLGKFMSILAQITLAATPPPGRAIIWFCNVLKACFWAGAVYA